MSDFWYKTSIYRMLCDAVNIIMPKLRGVTLTCKVPQDVIMIPVTKRVTSPSIVACTLLLYITNISFKNQVNNF